MSGFEIAGIVLGGFPILIEAAKPLVRYLQGAERWWHFRRDFMALISTIEDESIAYSQNLELLLTPVDIDPETKAILQEDPKSKLWHDPDVQAKLKGRVKSQYILWFQKQLLEMRKTLSELHGMLPVSPDGKVDFPRVFTLDYELFRLRQSFSTRRQHLLDTIVRINESLYKFLAKDSHINAEAARSGISWDQTISKKARTFSRLQYEAKKLSCALKDGWNCCCPHHCGVRLEYQPREPDSNEPNLKLLLETGASMKQTRVKLIKGKYELTDTSSSPSVTLDQMADLRMQAHRELTSNVFETRNRRSEVATSVITATSTLASPTMSVDLKSWLESEQTRLKKGEKCRVLQLSTQNTSPSGSTRKSVRFSHTPLSTSSTPSSHSQSWERDTCSFLKSTPTWTSNKYLKVNQDAIELSLHPWDHSILTESRVLDLEAFSKRMPRLPDRLEMGLEIARTILGLGTSCWIPKGWDRREVFVFDSPPMPTKPFLRHESLSFTLKETIDDPRLHTEATLFSLGVVLLELTYQETLEQQPFWNTYCDNGQPNDWTHQCTAMEWHAKVEARYGNDLSEPIRLCVESGFSRDADLDNLEFLQEVIDTVVTPLERFLSGWNGTYVRESR